MRRAYARMGVAVQPLRYQREAIAFATEQTRTIAIGQSRAVSEAIFVYGERNA
jgi:hypothetical protein